MSAYDASWPRSSLTSSRRNLGPTRQRPLRLAWRGCAAPRSTIPSAVEQPQPLKSPPVSNRGANLATEPQGALPRSIPKRRGGYEHD